MKKEEIEQAAKDYAALCTDNDDNEISFLRGANFVNERQPYSDKDVELILLNFGKDHKMSSCGLAIIKWWNKFKNEFAF